MREILFRGKRTDNGEWVEGYLYEHEPPLQCIVPENYIPEPSKWYIVRTAFADWGLPRQVEFIEVDPETVGQFTGLCDKNGKKIFEGDIVLGLFLFDMLINAVVKFRDGAFGLEWRRGEIIEFNAFTSLCNITYEIIGNIYDNPELLEG